MSDCRHNAPNREPQAGDVQIQRQQLDEQTREELLDKLIDCLYSFEDESDMAALDPGLAGDYASAMPPRGISAVSQPLSMPAGSAAGRSCPAGSGWRWLRSVSAPLAQIC